MAAGVPLRADAGQESIRLGNLSPKTALALAAALSPKETQ